MTIPAPVWTTRRCGRRARKAAPEWKIPPEVNRPSSRRWWPSTAATTGQRRTGAEGNPPTSVSCHLAADARTAERHQPATKFSRPNALTAFSESKGVLSGRRCPVTYPVDLLQIQLDRQRRKWATFWHHFDADSIKSIRDIPAGIQESQKVRK